MSRPAPDKRTAVLEATLDLVAELGLHAAPMSKVAARAGVGTGTIYRYFENKNTLINALYLELKKGVGNAVMLGDDPDREPEERFIHFWSNMFRHCVCTPKTTMFLEQCANSPIITQETIDLVHVRFAPLIDMFTELAERNVLKKMPKEMCAALTFEVALNLAKKQIAGYIRLSDEDIRTAAKACWDAVAV